MIKNLEQYQADDSRNHRNGYEVSKFFSFGMFSPFENKPNTKKIIGNNSATCRKNIA